MAWKDIKNDEIYSDAAVEERLKEAVNKWHLENGCICRTYKTSGWKGTLMLVNSIGHLAEVAFHHPDLEVSYAAVTVKLKTHSAKGITNKDFELANKIESVVMWQPEKDAGALEGVPDDSRFSYIIHD